MNKKTKSTEKLVIDFTKKSNENIGYGIVSLAVTTNKLLASFIGTPITFTSSDNKKITNPLITFCDNAYNDENHFNFCTSIPPT